MTYVMTYIMSYVITWLCGSTAASDSRRLMKAQHRSRSLRPSPFVFAPWSRAMAGHVEYGFTAGLFLCEWHSQHSPRRFLNPTRQQKGDMTTPIPAEVKGRILGSLPAWGEGVGSTEGSSSSSSSPSSSSALAILNTVLLTATSC